MQQEEQQINISINEGDPFFAHEATINFTPTQFSFDFKCITPRSDPRSKDKTSFQLVHNVVMVDTWHAKAIYQVLGNVLKKYEEEIGKIEKPKLLEKVEKKHKKMMEAAPIKTEAPTYLG